MSAPETIRTASRKMRAQVKSKDNPIPGWWVTMTADFLDATIEEWGDTVPLTSPIYKQAFQVARTYLGREV